MSRMTPFTKLIDFDQAKKTIMQYTKKIQRIEEVDISKAYGRVLAETVVASHNVPGFRRAAMDGYAVVASDTYQAKRLEPHQLQLKGKIFAGQTSDVSVKSGQCVQISTGAPMPEGADAVVMVEETELADKTVNIFKPVYPGGNVSNEDSDIKKGTLILEKETVLSPPKIGVLASLGFEKIKVYCQPEIIIFPTGDEIVTPGNSLDLGKIYDINSYTLCSLLESMGCKVTIHKITGDSKEELTASIQNALSYDFVIFSGGSSVGERDYLKDVIKDTGSLLFHGIALKPGKPTVCGMVNDTMVFGMPGYPTSCLTNAYVLLVPSVKKMARLPYNPEKKRVVLAVPIVSTIGRHQIYPVSVENDIAYPVFKESGAITSMAKASGYIEIPANVEMVEKESEVTVHLF